MTNPNGATQITTLAQLDAIYGDPVPRSLTKEIDYISDHYGAFIAAAPFVIIATSGPDGLVSDISTPGTD